MRGASWLRFVARPRILPGQVRPSHSLRHCAWRTTQNPRHGNYFSNPRDIECHQTSPSRNLSAFQSGTTDVNDDLFQALLSKAPHGINSLDRLAFEADVGHIRDRGRKLTDLPVNRQDLDLWLVLLEYRILKDGDAGVYDVLFGMRSRGIAVKLINYDDASETIWDLSLAAALRSKNVLSMLQSPRASIGRERPTLFLDLIGPLLNSGRVIEATNVTKLLQPSHLRRDEDLMGLTQLLLNGGSTISIDNFGAVLRCLPSSSVYEQIVPALWNKGRAHDAFLLHSILIDNQDFPKRFTSIEPSIRHLVRQEKPLTPFLEALEKHGLGFTTQARRFYTQVKNFESGIPVEAFDLLKAQDTNIRQRKLKDQFVARVFATHALSFEFALRGLKFFGLVEIGPLAVREMATSAQSVEEINERFRLLGELDIDTGSSAFVVVVKRLSNRRSPVMLRAILNCDLHHEVFDDQTTQRRLLKEYFKKKDWPQINRTLAILNRGDLGPEAQERAQYLLIACAVDLRDWKAALSILANMMRRPHTDLLLSEPRSIDWFLDSLVETTLLETRRVGQSFQQNRSRLRYLIGLLQNIQAGGNIVQSSHWQNICVELGRLGFSDDLQGVCKWLIVSHKQIKLGRGITQPLSGKRPQEEHFWLRSIFDDSLQAQIIWWSLTTRYRSNDCARNLEQKSWGVHILRLLHSTIGARMEYMAVKGNYVQHVSRILPQAEDLEHYAALFDSVWIYSMQSFPERNTDQDAQHMRSAESQSNP